MTLSIWGSLIKHVFNIPSAHVLIHANTRKLTVHTYSIDNDITKQNQPDAKYEIVYFKNLIKNKWQKMIIIRIK